MSKKYKLTVELRAGHLLGQAISEVLDEVETEEEE